VSQAIGGGEDAEEKIAARKRILAGVDPTGHAQEGSIDIDSKKGESAAIIAKEHVLGDVPSRRLLCDLVGEGSGGFA